MGIATTLRKKTEVQKEWWVVDAADQVLGRLASRVALILKGKHKPDYTPNVDGGDFVVIVNAEKIRVTGKKEEQKFYHRTSGRPGGLKSVVLKEQRAKHPEQILEHALKGMLPKNKLGDRMIRHVKIYRGPNHPHAAQNPKPLPLK